MLFHPFTLLKYLNPSTVKGVIHIGAHLCEEKQYYNQLLHIQDDKILWIEGNPDIANKAKMIHPSATIINALCSNKDGETIEFMITNNGQSSSILPFGTHTTHHPEVGVVGYQKAISIKLDTICSGLEWTKECNMINIDVQGAEKMVLEGADEVLKHIDFIYAEVNEEEVYKGCSLLPEFDSFLESKGFKRVLTHMTDWKWGDALYQKV
jgi:FkbM family methyltransferase